RHEDGLIQTTWAEVLTRAQAALQQHRGEAIAVLAAPRGTNEDLYLLAKLAAEACQTSRFYLYGGEPGDEDDFLMRADPNPNTRGAQEIGLPAPATPEALASLAEAVEQGEVKVLYAIDADLDAVFGAERLARLIARLDCLIVQTANAWPGYDRA